MLCYSDNGRHFFEGVLLKCHHCIHGATGEIQLLQNRSNVAVTICSLTELPICAQCLLKLAQ